MSTLNDNVFSIQSRDRGIDRNSLLSEGNILRQWIQHYDGLYGQKERDLGEINVTADSGNHRRVDVVFKNSSCMVRRCCKIGARCVECISGMVAMAGLITLVHCTVYSGLIRVAYTLESLSKTLKNAWKYWHIKVGRIDTTFCCTENPLGSESY